MKGILVLLALLTASIAMAGTNRVLDGVTVTNTGAVLTFPTNADTLAGIAQTQTFTNKSISGSTNTLTNIPANTALTSQVPVANGGTGAATLTSNGIVYGNGTSAVGITAAGTQYQCLQAGSGGTPQFNAVQLNQSAAVSGSLAVANGGTGGTTQATGRSGLGAAASGANSDITSLTGLTTPLSVAQGGTGASTLTTGNVIIGAGTSQVTLVAPGSSGNILTSNGTTWTSAAASTIAPSLGGTSGASPQGIVAATALNITGYGYNGFLWVTGNTGAVTVTATPSLTAGSNTGQLVTIIGYSNTNTVTLQDAAGLSGSSLHLNGTWVGAQYSALTLVWDGTYWNEISRR
jgi:hypothetical protein